MFCLFFFNVFSFVVLNSSNDFHFYTQKKAVPFFLDSYNLLLLVYFFLFLKEILECQDKKKERRKNLPCAKLVPVFFISFFLNRE